jgi:hypothetical protein
VVEADDNEAVLYNLLYISYRVRYKDQYLIKELGKHEEFWKCDELWGDIIEYIRLTKLKGRINQGPVEPNREQRLKQIFNKAMWTMSRQRPNSNKKFRSEKVIQETKVY